MSAGSGSIGDAVHRVGADSVSGRFAAVGAAGRTRACAILPVFSGSLSGSREELMAAKSTTTVEVEIYGSTYHVRGDNDGSYLQELAGLVDEKMHEVTQHLGTVDRAKIAILAALNLADEMVRARRELSEERAALAGKVSELTGELDLALKG
jgi:cell division protein ZapA